MSTLFGMYPFLEKLCADSAYHGRKFASALRNISELICVEIVKRSDGAKGFKILPKHWVVERSIGWLGRFRRLAKDWECLNRKGLAFLHRKGLAFLR